MQFGVVFSLPPATFLTSFSARRLYQHAVFSQGMNRYIRKRKLDPLDTYVPSVLRAKSQLIEVGNVMGTDNSSPPHVGHDSSFYFLFFMGRHTLQSSPACCVQHSFVWVLSGEARVSAFEARFLGPAVTDPTEARIMLRGGAFTGLRDSVKCVPPLLGSLPSPVPTRAHMHAPSHSDTRGHLRADHCCPALTFLHL